MATPAQQSASATALPMLVKKLTSSPSITSYPPLFEASRNTRIISKQLEIKLGQFTQEVLDSVQRKIKNKKSSRAWWNTPRSMEDQGIRRHTAPTL